MPSIIAIQLIPTILLNKFKQIDPLIFMDLSIFQKKKDNIQIDIKTCVYYTKNPGKVFLSPNNIRLRNKNYRIITKTRRSCTKISI